MNSASTEGSGAEEKGIEDNRNIEDIVSDLFHLPAKRKLEELNDTLIGKKLIIGNYSKKTPSQLIKEDKIKSLEEKCNMTKKGAKIDIEKLYVPFGTAIEMNRLWDIYAKSLLSECNNKQLLSIIETSRKSHTGLKTSLPILNASFHFIANMDFHGAPMIVSKCSNYKLVGLKGVCVCETKNAFALATPRDEKVIVIPKKGTMMCVLLPDPVPQILDAKKSESIDTSTSKKGKYRHLAVYIDCTAIRQTSVVRSTKSYKERRVWGDSN